MEGLAPEPRKTGNAKRFSAGWRVEDGCGSSNGLQKEKKYNSTIIM
jgi:hypothetical protein